MKPAMTCPGPVSRREFMHIGALSLGAIGTAGITPWRLVAKDSGKDVSDPSVIFIWLPGGPPHMETYDMKPNAPVEYRGEFRPIRTVVPGLDVCELLPQHAKVADRFSIIRSVSHGYIQHGGGTKQMLMGRPPLRPEGEGANEYPVIGSVVSKMREGQRTGLPNYILCTDEGTLTAPHQSAYLGPA